MGFCHVTLTVRDLDASIRFYTETAGLSVDRRFQSGPDAEIAFLGSGETKVELIRLKNGPEVTMGNGISIGFAVEDVPGKLESLRERGVPIVSGILQPNPHVRYFYAADPDGARVQFLELL